MKLNLPALRTLYLNEMRMILRDRRTIIMAVVLPMVVLPVVLFASSWTRERREAALARTVYRYAVAGANEEQARAIVARAREVALTSTNANVRRLHFEEKSVTNVMEALDRREIHFFVEGIDPEESAGADDHDGRDVLRIVYRGDRDDSGSGASAMQALLAQAARAQRRVLLEAHAFPVPPEQVAAVSSTDLASKGQAAGLALGRIITLLVLVLIFSGGAVVASDLLAGEKERGTLETLLTTCAGRTEVIAAKHLVTLSMALFITLLQGANLLVCVGFRLIPVPADLAAALPVRQILLLLFLLLPVAALAAGMLLLTSGYARTYKEAQLYFLPVVLLGVVPALAPFFPDLPLRSILVLVPVSNIAIAVKDALSGVFDWPMIVLAWLVTGGAAAAVMRWSVAFLSEERLVMPAAGDAAEFAGGPARFSRHAASWFAALWAVLWIVNSYISSADIRVQLFVNLVVLFFGASLLMMWRYRLNPREALALRMPRLAVWPALLCAIPGGALTANGLARLSTRIIPVPSEALDEFTRSVIPEGMDLFQLLFFLAVMPAIFEEIAFRGLLLHGLHRRLRPVALAVVVGLVFGIFHFALFRFVGTAFLGALLAAVTLLTGSLLPAVVWHAANNALGVIAARNEIPMSDLHPGYYLAGAGLLAVGFWIVWKNRTPYPGLRPYRKSA
ncbi:MAG TPA: CPBP family intramembrane metalloprotease [Verrucomicrobia bacterium]|nr:CPBP family intramembrane metalloprotease [Verrucomicrobiota bacterium]HOP96442.1 ABC transporter permease subunit [Verrucomicrobiota bacterium]